MAVLSDGLLVIIWGGGVVYGKEQCKGRAKEEDEGLKAKVRDEGKQ